MLIKFKKQKTTHTVKSLFHKLWYNLHKSDWKYEIKENSKQTRANVFLFNSKFCFSPKVLINNQRAMYTYSLLRKSIPLHFFKCIIAFYCAKVNAFCSLYFCVELQTFLYFFGLNFLAKIRNINLSVSVVKNSKSRKLLRESIGCFINTVVFYLNALENEKKAYFILCMFVVFFLFSVQRFIFLP